MNDEERRLAVAELKGRIRVLEDMKDDDGFCRGHPFQHTFFNASGYCAACGRRQRPEYFPK